MMNLRVTLTVLVALLLLASGVLCADPPAGTPAAGPQITVAEPKPVEAAPSKPTLTRTLSIPATTFSPSELDNTLKMLQKQFSGFSAQRSGESVLMLGTAEQLLAAETVLRHVGHLADFDFARYPLVDKDPASVDQAVNFILQVAATSGRGPLALLREGNTLLIWGSEEDRAWAEDKVSLLASPTPALVLTQLTVADQDPASLDQIAALVRSLADSLPGHTPFTLVREGKTFWICASQENCDWAKEQITKLIAEIAPLSLESYDISTRNAASVDQVLQLIKDMAAAQGHAPLTLLREGSRLVLWGSDADRAWAKEQLLRLAEAAAPQEMETYWLRGTVNPRDVADCLTRGRWPSNSWAISGRRIQITAEEPAKQGILDTLWSNDFLYTRLFKSLNLNNLDPDKAKLCKLPEIPNVAWRWDFAQNGLLVTGFPEASTVTYSQMIYHDPATDPNGIYPWSLVYNYPSEDMGDDDCPAPEAETVRLYYARDPEHVAELLDTARSSCGAEDVSVSANTASGALPGIVLVGPKLQIRNLERVLEQIDLPHPEVRLQVWSCQLSGNDAASVARRARLAQQHVECTARLVRGYLHVLTHYATELEQYNSSNLGKVTVASAAYNTEAFALVFPPAAHVPSLTDVLLAQMLLIPAGVWGDTPGSAEQGPANLSAVREQLGNDLRKEFRTWLATLQTSDPEALAAWADVAQDNGYAQRLGKVGDWLQKPPGTDLPAGPADLDGLLPQRFLDMLTTPDDVANIQAVLSRYLVQGHENNETDPDRVIALRADAQTLLQRAAQNLADDIREIFLDPMEEDLRRIASTGDRYGLGSVSTTSVSVLSESQGQVQGATSSYFQASPAPVSTEDFLKNVSDYEGKIGGAFPQATRGGGGGGGAEAGSAPAAASTASGTVSAASQAGAAAAHAAAGLEPAQLAAVGLAVADQPPVWASMDEGANLTFTPRVLRGGSGTELTIDFMVNHQAPESLPPGAEAPLSRVASHHAVTTVYLQPLDLFSLSSFSMETTLGRRMEPMPVLGYLPLLGQLFRYQSAADHIHHESLLIVYSTVLPTANDWEGTLQVTPAEGIGPLTRGAPPTFTWSERGWERASSPSTP
jgi:hypothetical protein